MLKKENIFEFSLCATMSENKKDKKRMNVAIPIFEVFCGSDSAFYLLSPNS